MTTRNCHEVVGDDGIGIGAAIAACGDEWSEIGLGFKWFQVLETQEDGSLKLVEENAK